MLRRALAGLGQMEEHALLIVVAALHLVCVHHHGGHAGDQIDTLVQDILQAQILGVLIIRVKAQHAALQLIHDIGRGGVHGVHEAFRQGAVLCQDLTEIVQLLPVGQTAEQQQPDHLFKHKAVIAVGLVHDLVDVHTAVDQLAGSGDHMAFLILLITHNVTDIGQASQNAGAVRVAQAALDAQPITRLRVDLCQFLTRFDRYLLYCTVIEFAFDAYIFKSGNFIGNEFFSFDVPFVFDTYLGSFYDFFPQIIIKNKFFQRRN